MSSLVGDCDQLGTQTETALAWVGLGGNLGEVKKTIAAALHQLMQHEGVDQLKASSFYRSAPVDAQGADFINAVACFETTLKPLALLHLLQSIENIFGRERPYRHAPRTLDLDLLLYGNVSMQDAELTLPHHAMHERAFVLLPMAELDDEIVIPNHGTVKSLLKCVLDQRIERIADKR